MNSVNGTAFIALKKIEFYYVSHSTHRPPNFFESGIFCLFIFWVFFPDKIVKLLSKYSQKCQYRRWVAKFAIMLHSMLGQNLNKRKESEEY